MDDPTTLKLKNEVARIHGRATVDELPEMFWDVLRECYEDEDATEEYARGVIAAMMNLAGAVSDGDLRIDH